LLVATTYISPGTSVEVGPLHFTAIRIIAVVGVLRVMVKGERLAGGFNALDRLMVLWAVCAVASSCFHKDFTAALILRLGMAYDCLGIYFLLRIFIRDSENVVAICKIVILLLIPIALEMVAESRTGTDKIMILFGGPISECEVRDGKIRAEGPFLHSILAGTVGGACFPLALLLWNKNRKLALAGVATTAAMVLTSRSSGPVMTLMMGLAGLALWKLKERMRLVRWAGVFVVIALAVVMNAPIYYLLARIDLTGSSSSYFRAALIEAAINHFSEWWFAGTDYTRHWMASGVGWSSDHTDITNYYLKMGVLGGLPLMLSFIGILVAGFISVGKALRLHQNGPAQFMIWTLGAILFAHCITFLSISYFDQTVVFLYLILATISSLSAAKVARRLSHKVREKPIERTVAADASPSYG